MVDVAGPAAVGNPVSKLSGKDVIAPILGVGVLLAFGAFIVFLLKSLDLTDTQWSRAIYLFAGVEAVAFAAAGYFFGTQVQRGKVEEAKADAKAAERVASVTEDKAKAERRAAKVFATGYVKQAESDGLLLGNDRTSPANEALLAQARALLED